LPPLPGRLGPVLCEDLRVTTVDIRRSDSTPVDAGKFDDVAVRMGGAQPLVQFVARADVRARRSDVAGNQWPFIRAERAALIADLENVSDAAWSTPSLCAGWTVREVLAHMTSVAKMTPGRFIGKFAGSGFRFNAMNESCMKAELGPTPAETLAGFKAQLDGTIHPLGGVDTLVGDMVIHSQDIRRPLGIPHTFQPEALTLVGDVVIRGNLLLGGKRRATGLKLTATDQDWTRGAGLEVKGPLASIIIVLTGRKAGLPDLSGDGSPS